MTKTGQHWEYPNKITVQNNGQSDKMTKALHTGGKKIRLATDFSTGTFNDKSHWSKTLNEFESRIFKCKGYSFDPIRIQGLWFTWAPFEESIRRHPRSDSGHLNKMADSKHKSKTRQRWG